MSNPPASSGPGVPPAFSGQGDPAGHAPAQPRGPAVPDIVLMALLLAVAVAVRLVRLASDPIWFDEAATLGIARMDWAVIFGAMADAESSPPGYYVLAKLWLAAWGESIYALRLLSVAAGVAAIPMVWLMARAAAGPNAAWFAAVLLALSATHVRMSQDGRCYTVLFLAVVLAMPAAWAMVRRIRAGRAAGPQAILFGALMGGMLWLHATAAIIGLSLNAFVVAGLLGAFGGPARPAAGPPPAPLRHGLLWLLVADLVAAVVAAPPLLAMLQMVVATPEFVDRWIDPPSLRETARIYLRALVAPFLSLLGILPLALYSALLALAGRAWWRTRNPLLLAMAAMLLAGGIALPVASLLRPILLERTALFLLAPLLVLLAAGLAGLPRRIALPVALLLVAAQALGLAGWHRLETRKERWDDAAAYLAREARPDDVVLMVDSAFLDIALAHHMRAIGAKLPPVVLVPPTSRLEQLAAAELMPERIVAAAQLCTTPGNHRVAFLVLRDQPDVIESDTSFSTRVPVRAALRAAGATLAGHGTAIGIDIERWNLPGCAIAPPARPGG